MLTGQAALSLFDGLTVTALTIPAPLGRTSRLVTHVGFGSMHFDSIDDEASVVRLVNGVLDLGVKLIDTARLRGLIPAHSRFRCRWACIDAPEPGAAAGGVDRDTHQDEGSFGGHCEFEPLLAHLSVRRQGLFVGVGVGNALPLCIESPNPDACGGRLLVLGDPAFQRQTLATHGGCVQALHKAGVRRRGQVVDAPRWPPLDQHRRVRRHPLRPAISPPAFGRHR